MVEAVANHGGVPKLNDTENVCFIWFIFIVIFISLAKFDFQLGFIDSHTYAWKVKNDLLTTGMNTFMISLNTHKVTAWFSSYGNKRDNEDLKRYDILESIMMRMNWHSKEVFMWFFLFHDPRRTPQNDGKSIPLCVQVYDYWCLLFVFKLKSNK